MHLLSNLSRITSYFDDIINGIFLFFNFRLISSKQKYDQFLYIDLEF